jgi:hypothetical protein
MATAMIFEGHPLSVPAAKRRPAAAPAVPTSAWPASVRVDYDAYRAEALRLRRQALKDTFLLVGRSLRRLVAG